MGRLARLWLLAATWLVVAACTAPAPAPASGGDGREPRSGARKTLTISLEGEINALATSLDSSGVSGLSTYVHSFLHNYVTVDGDNDEVLPQLASELPSVDAGTWKVLDDGRMQVTWKLRKGALWHDGAEFTAADVKFGWEVEAHPANPLGVRTATIQVVESMEIPDPHTLVVYWKGPNRFGGQMMRGEIEPLPRHLLEADFRANAEAFGGHAYFLDTSVVIGTGAYRAITWERGSHLVAEAFDRYHQGRAKIDRVIFKFIPDDQTTLANILSGEVDVANRGFSYDGALYLEREWVATGKGTVQNQPTNWRYNLFQFRPEVVQPRDLLQRDVRKAVILAFDKESAVEAMFPGLGKQMVAHAIGYPGTPIGDALERTIVKYPYDPNRAEQLLEAAGWRKGGDGILAKPNGEQFLLALNASTSDEDSTVFALMESDLRKVGIKLSFATFGGRRQEPALSVQFTGLQKTGFPFNHPTFGGRWDSRLVAGPENRYGAANRSGYVNPRVDELLDRLDASIRPQEELRYWGDVWRIITDDATAMSLYFVPQPIAVRKGVTGVIPPNPSGSTNWRVHLWDIE